MAALVNIPDSELVKVVYGFGYGTGGFHTSSPIAGQLLMLTGEVDDSTPSCLMLPSHIRLAKEMVCPTDETFKTTLAAVPTAPWPLITLRGAHAEVSDISKLAPIPAFLVYDGRNKDLHATEVFERLTSVDDQDNAMIIHAKNSCKCCMVKRRATDGRNYGPQQAYMMRLPQEARGWAKTRLGALLPRKTVQTRKPATNPSAQNATLEAILRQMATSTPRQNDSIEVQKVLDSAEENFGMSKTELAKTLQM